MNNKTLISASLAFALASASAATAAAPTLPVPSGPYGIGRTGYDWTDVSRPDRFSTDPQSHRELMVYLWYPIAKPSAAVEGVYLPGAKQMDAQSDIQRSMRENYSDNWPLIVSGAIYSHAKDSAPPAAKPQLFPVVILSHGLGSSGFGYTTLIEDLVSHGYVVAAIEHTYTAGAVLFSDGRIIPFRRDPTPPGLTPDEQFKRMMKSVGDEITEGAADVRFVLIRLAELNNANAPRSLLAGRLDLNHLAAMGHSAGAEFAARACQLDSRIKACVDLDGGMVPVSALPEYPDGRIIHQPLLFLEVDHSNSKMFGSPDQLAAYSKKVESQLQASAPGSYHVILRPPGIFHGSFSDDPLLEAAGQQDKIASALHNLSLIQAYVRAFLDKNLKQEKEPVLDDPAAAHPAATVERLGK